MDTVASTSNHPTRKNTAYQTDNQMSTNGPKRQCRQRAPTRITTNDCHNSKTIHDIPFDVLKLCFNFLGKRCYRYIAGTSKNFLLVYEELLVEKQHQKITGVEILVSSTACVQIFIQEGGLNECRIQYLWCHAASQGRVGVIDFLNDCGLADGWSEAGSELAAEHGHLDVLVWLRRNRFVFGIETCSIAAAFGHIHILEWYSERRESAEWDSVRFDICPAAAGGGNLSVLEWARQHDCPSDEDTCSSAARGGFLSILQYLRAHGCPWNEDTCTFAAEGGHLSMLKWARRNGCLWDEDTCSSAARCGHLPVLQYVRANGCPWDVTTCTYAAVEGHLSVLKWARANGCPWNEDTCSFAAEGGHLSALKWARRNGCPWDKFTIMFAEQAGHLELLAWAKDNGCPQN